MKGLFSIFKMRFGLILNYRVAAVAGVFTQLFFGIVMVMVYVAFFESSRGVGFPMTLSQTVTYIWLGQSLLGLLPWNGDREIQGMIRTGEFAYELVRPLDLYNYWFYRITAQRIASTLIRSIPLIVIAVVLMPESYKMQGPVNGEGFLLFFITVISGIILGGTISNIITISVLFTIGDGVERLLPAIVTIFSGMVIPLSFFPDWIQPVLRFLPFSGLVDGPYKFYLGIYTINELPSLLLHQIIWTVLLMGLGRWMLKKARQRVVVQGG